MFFRVAVCVVQHPFLLGESPSPPAAQGMFSSLISQAYLIINESEALHERRQLISASIVAAAGAGIRSQVKLHEYVCLQGLMCKTIHP